jgi:hypothetical protein
MIESVLDLPVAIILALMALADGVRQVPSRAIVARRVLTGPWQVVSEEDESSRWRLVSWWSPLSTTVVLAAADRTAGPARSEFTCRSSSVADHLKALRVVGAATLLVLVIGVPVAVRQMNALGFAYVLATLCVLVVVSFLVLAHGYRRLGYKGRRAVHALSPFTAPRAGELLLQTVADGLSPVAVLCELLPPSRLAEHLRPRVYDARVRHHHDVELESLVTQHEQAAILAPPDVPPSDAALAYCPRCGVTWRKADVECTDCGVPVRRFFES